MSEKQTSFTVTDRRKFTLEGELRDPASAATIEEEIQTNPPPPPAPEAGSVIPTTTSGATIPEGQPMVVDSEPSTAALEDEALTGENMEDDLGPMPTHQESAAQHAAYQKSSSHLDDMIRQANPGAPPSAEIDFEQVIQSFYLSAALAMGAATEPGQQPQIDIIGARQSIDMLTVLAEKTKGNLTDREQKLLQSALFNLRMMFLEITNSIAAQATKAPRPGSNARTK